MTISAIRADPRYIEAFPSRMITTSPKAAMREPAADGHLALVGRAARAALGATRRGAPHRAVQRLGVLDVGHLRLPPSAPVRRSGHGCQAGARGLAGPRGRPRSAPRGRHPW